MSKNHFEATKITDPIEAIKKQVRPYIKWVILGIVGLIVVGIVSAVLMVMVLVRVIDRGSQAAPDLVRRGEQWFNQGRQTLEERLNVDEAKIKQLEDQVKQLQEQTK